MFTDGSTVAMRELQPLDMRNSCDPTRVCAACHWGGGMSPACDEPAARSWFSGARLGCGGWWASAGHERMDNWTREIGQPDSLVARGALRDTVPVLAVGTNITSL